MEDTMNLNILNATIKQMKEDCPNWRYGQCCFNALHLLYPALANTIRGTSDDPFFSDSEDDELVLQFWEFCEDVYYNQYNGEL